MELFTWCPLINPTGDIKLRTLTAQFGDGLQQAAGDGINNKVQVWPLQFAGKEAYITPIKNFLDAHKGYRSFLWTPPLSGQIVVRASQYSPVAMGVGLYTLSVTFNQVGTV